MFYHQKKWRIIGGRIILLCLLSAFNQNAIAQKAADYKPFEPGTFVVGCNYWASHAGSHMWRDWKPEVIEADFKQLAASGIKVIRVFPLWPDFQPIRTIYSGGGSVKYIATPNGQPLPIDGPGSDGMSLVQMDHFATLTKLASKYNLKLIVGLITGWMSGELYMPPALAEKNLLTDSESLVWQKKFVTSFVRRFKSDSAIIAWDFGNECNVMQELDNHYQADVWASLLSGAIRSEDNSRPILSGMTGLSAQDDAAWRIVDQAATTDVLTTHPYSLWTEYASQDGIHQMRTVLQSSAQTTMFADIGGKPALVEETGVMGPMTGGELEKSAFARTSLFSNWAHDCLGTLWWCAYDQLSLKYPPYNYAAVEAELGLFKEDRTPKPVAQVIKNFSQFITTKLPFQKLPKRKTEAVCILTEGQDSWAVAYTSFVLATQAGFDFQFQKAGQPIKDAPLYILPSIKGTESINKQYWFQLLEKVKAGATLYLSLDDVYLPSFTEPLGIKVAVNIKRRQKIAFISKLFADSLNFIAIAERKFEIDPLNNTVLAKEADGNPVFLKSKLGRGSIYLLTFPMESYLTTHTGAFDEGAPAYYEIYKKIAAPLIAERIIAKDNPFIGTTEHALNERKKIVILINYNTGPVQTNLSVHAGWKITEALYGRKPAGNNPEIPGNDALVLIVEKSQN